MIGRRCNRKCPNTCETCSYQQLCHGCSEHCIYHFIGEDICTYQLALTCKRCPFTFFELENYKSYPVEALNECIRLANEPPRKFRQPETIPQLIPIIEPYNLSSHFHQWRDVPEALGINIWDTLQNMKRINSFAVLGFKGFFGFKSCKYPGKVYAFSIPPDRLAANFDVHSIAIFAARLDLTFTPEFSADALALTDPPDYADLPKQWTWTQIFRYLASLACVKQNFIPDVVEIEQLPGDLTEQQLNDYATEWRRQRRAYIEKSWTYKQDLSQHFRNLAWDVTDRLYSYLMRVNIIPFLAGTHLDQFKLCAEKLRALNFGHVILNVKEWARYHRWKQIKERIDLARTFGFEQIVTYGLNPGKIPPHVFLTDSYATKDFFKDAQEHLRYTMKGRVVKDTLRAYRECNCRACEAGPDYRTPMGLAYHNLLIMKRRIVKFGGV